MKIKTVLATKGTHAFTVTPRQTVREAAAMLERHDVEAVMVVDPDGSPVGIISESDMVRAAARDPAAFGRPVDEFMTRELVVGSPEDDLHSVMHTMLDRRVRHIPILDGGRLVGVVPIGDVVKVLLEHYQGQVDTLQAQIEDPA